MSYHDRFCNFAVSEIGTLFALYAWCVKLGTVKDAFRSVVWKEWDPSLPMAGERETDIGGRFAWISACFKTSRQTLKRCANAHSNRYLRRDIFKLEMKRTHPSGVLSVKEVLPVAARALGLTVRSWDVRDAGGFVRIFTALNKDRSDGLYVLGGALMIANEKRTIGFALKSRLPSVYNNREAVEAGGLMYYGSDIADIYRRVAYFVDRILKGAKPADLPVEQPTKFELVIQSENGEADRPDDPARVAGPGE